MSPRQRWIAIVLAAIATPTASGVEHRVTIRGIGIELGETPVYAQLESGGPGPGAYLLREVDPNGESLDAQIVREGESMFLATVLRSLGPEEAAEFVLVPHPASGEAERGGIRVIPEGRNLRVTIDGELFTVYHADDGPKPYFHPLIGPTGSPMTRAYPMEDVQGEDRDHPHQRSFWFTHGDVNGVDFWASDPLNTANPRFGSIEAADHPEVIDGPVVGVIRTTNRWLAPDGKVLCTDERTWRTYDTERMKIIDADFLIKSTNGPVTFGDTKEGMFGLRLASSMNVRNNTGGRIINAEGISDLDAWGKASPWVDYTGPVGGELLGVAILNHPDSFRFPTTWHVRDYGLFAANPFGYGDFQFGKEGAYTIPSGDSIGFRYRVILHEGDAEQAAIDRSYRAYARPPKVEISGGD